MKDQNPKKKADLGTLELLLWHPSYWYVIFYATRGLQPLFVQNNFYLKRDLTVFWTIRSWSTSGTTVFNICFFAYLSLCFFAYLSFDINPHHLEKLKLINRIKCEVNLHSHMDWPQPINNELHETDFFCLQAEDSIQMVRETLRSPEMRISLKPEQNYSGAHFWFLISWCPRL